ncbi:MAG: N-acetylneuraminate synthase [Paenibacillus sp.]|nr:N-acetylneuraminate synthase [Paenibacillus sp.]
MSNQHHHTIIIAEAGVNHNGSVENAIKLVHKAAEAGVDYVKFQTFKAENLVSASAPKAQYQKENCGSDGNQLSMLKALELTEAEFILVAEECRKCGIGFLSTPFDMDSIGFLSRLDMDYWKIPSGEITNLPYLRRIAGMDRRVILSTGMSTLSEVNDAVKALNDSGLPSDKIYLLHCTTQYPTPFEAVNLRAMETLRQVGCAGVGYSDHTRGISVPIAAVAIGAQIIEKHFTLDRSMPGPDHKASLTPDELADMVKAIREVELAVGSSAKEVTEVERPNITVARKSIVASRHINKGELLTDDNLTAKRPGDGLSPMMWDSVIGTTAIRDFDRDEQIRL